MPHRAVPIVVSTLAFVLAGAASAQQFQNQTSTRFPVQNFYSNQMTIVDLNNDGHLDIVFADGQGYQTQGAALKPRIYMNDGLGFFADETDARAPGVQGWFRGVEAGDVNDDGWVDLILAQDFNKVPILLINTGNGFFVNETAARLPNIAMSSARAQFGDVDNDGDLDLIFNNSGATNRFGTGQPRIYLNDGSGFFTDATATNFPAGNISQQMDILFCDIDLDFDLDIFVGTRATSPNQSRLWKNNGSGVFTLQAGFPNDSASYSIDVGDIDGDGDLDAISVNGGVSNAELLARNNGGGNSWTNISSSISPNPTVDDNDSRFFDYDNDGDLDLIVGSLGSSERLYNNNGSGFFTQVSGVIPVVSDATLDIKVADLNGDGRLDFVTAQGEAGSFQNKIYINVTGPIDTIAPKIVSMEGVPNGNPLGTPSEKIVRVIIYDSHTSDRGFHDKGIFLHYTATSGCTVIEGQVPMKWVGNNLWRGVIPAMPAGASVSYFVTAIDHADNVGTGPTRDYIEAGPPPVAGDVNGDQLVNGADIALILGNWGGTGEGDLNCDEAVNGADIAIVLGNWGN
ncbi:MAG: VCBS repeat-containing protein [Phycisphaeraceae bacterium]|nr:VCBS repeat-containing protein [Phycisphaeraceae bacterium]